MVAPKSIAPFLRFDFLIGLVVVWCASGLVALDMSQLYPTSVSPMLHQYFSPILGATVAFLLAAPLAAHFTGKFVHKTYRLWQPFRGGRRFILAQSIGWVLITSGIFLLG